jgi:hypothetical protein
LLLTGCTKEAPIPVSYDCPSITLPPDPKLPTPLLTSASTPDSVMKWWVAYGYSMRGWNKAVRAEITNAK